MRWFLSFVFVTWNALYLFASDASVCGHVVAVQGTVVATNQLQDTKRVLFRGAALFTADVLTTGPDGKIQLKFTDEGLVNLLPNTVYRISSYSFSDEKQDIAVDLFEGGFRAMTGNIGKQNPGGYQVTTPVATIGIRGTIFDAFFQDGELNVGTVFGTVIVHNAAGSVELSSGMYVSAMSYSELGKPETTAPAVFTELNFAPPVGGESVQRAQSKIEGRSMYMVPKSSSAKVKPNPPSAKTKPMQSPRSPEKASEKEGEWLHVPASQGNPACG